LVGQPGRVEEGNMEEKDINKQGSFILCIAEPSFSVPRSPVGDDKRKERMRELVHAMLFG
jgi:hypothetical protein